MINFGVQLGGGGREKIQPIHILLNKIFNNIQEEYFENIDSFGIYFRVDGSFKSFGEEGPDRLNYLKKRRSLVVDYVIPEKVWKENNNQYLVEYFSTAVCNCFSVLLEEANKRKFIINKHTFVDHITKNIELFKIEAGKK